MSGKAVRSRTYSRLVWTRLAIVAILILVTILLASFAALTTPSRAYAAEARWSGMLVTVAASAASRSPSRVAGI